MGDVFEALARIKAVTGKGDPVSFHEAMENFYEVQVTRATSPERKERYEDLAWEEHLAAQVVRRCIEREASGIKPWEDDDLKARLATIRNKERSQAGATESADQPAESGDGHG